MQRKDNKAIKEIIEMGDVSEHESLLKKEVSGRQSHGSVSSDYENTSTTGSEDDKVDYVIYSPNDRFYFVYAIFYLLGVGALLPWNFFSNGRQYFLYKLRNTSATNESNYDVPSFETHMQSTFENYLTIAAMLPNVIFLFLNTATTKLISCRVRVIVSLLLMVTMFAVTMAMARVVTDDWQSAFFVITIITIIVMNAASAVFQGAIFGLSARLPKEYSQSVMAGMGMGGIIAAVANIICLSVGSGPVESGFGYFLTALLVLILALVGYLILPLSAFARHYTADIPVTKGVHLNDQDCEIYKEIQDKKIPLFAVFKQVWQVAFCVFFIYFVTLSCYPAINSAIKSENFAPKLHRPWSDKYFEPVMCFLVFNLFDFLGRTFAGVFQCPNGSSFAVKMCSLLRVVFIVIFIFCNVQPRKHLPVIFHSDWIPISAGVLYGLSNGYLSTLCMMFGPRLVSVENMEMAGSMLSFFIALGLGVGSIFSLFLRVFI